MQIGFLTCSHTVVCAFQLLTRSPFGSQSKDAAFIRERVPECELAKETTCKRIVHVDLLFPSDMDQSGQILRVLPDPGISQTSSLATFGQIRRAGFYDKEIMIPMQYC